MRVPTVLLVEDNPSFHSLLLENLQNEGFNVLSAFQGDEGVRMVAESAVDICLTDDLMPVTGGMDMVRELRRRGYGLPVVMLAEDGSGAMMAEAFAAGCDAFLFKPVSIRVIAGQLRALLRLTLQREQDQPMMFDFGGVLFDAVRQQLGEQPLSSRENELLLLLARRQGQIVDRSLILNTIWSSDTYFAARSLAVYIHRLRGYLQAASGWQIISAHGKGYKLAAKTTENVQ